MLAIIDYEAGNLTSVKLALEYLGCECVITQNPQTVKTADRVIFPGVGYAETCMANLHRLGLDAALCDFYLSGKPLLAICIGMQLIFSRSTESSTPDGVRCLNFLAGEVQRFAFPDDRKIKIPHMGWNEILPRREHPLLKNLPPQSEVYFVHSYFAAPQNSADLIAETEYGGKFFAAIVGKNNLIATQFHPEKSGELGLQMLRNFVAWNGKN